jgi:hypothetical protein
MNRKNEKLWESRCKNNGKRSSGSRDMGSWSFQGQNDLFRSVLGFFLEFWSGWRVLAPRIGAVAKIENFSGVFIEFLGYLE